MLKKKNRVGRKTIEQIFKEGRFVNGPHLAFKFIFDKNSKNQAISFLVPKNVVKKAVLRNLLRRRGYFVLKKYINTIPVGIYGVFIFGKDSLELFSIKKTKNNNPIMNLENEIKNLLSKIN